MIVYKQRIIIIFILLLSSFTHCHVLIKLKKFNDVSDIYNENYSPEILIKNLFNQYYSFLNVGNPPQKTELQISMEELGLVMKEDICLTSFFYNKNKSLTLNQTHYYDIDKYSKKTVVVNETIDFPVFDTKNNKLSEITIPDYIFIYNKANQSEDIEEEKIEKEKGGKACIVFGFKIMCEQRDFYCKKILS